MFQGKVLEEYDRLVDEFGLEVDRCRAQHHRRSSRSVRRLIASQMPVASVETSDEQLV